MNHMILPNNRRHQRGFQNLTLEDFQHKLGGTISGRWLHCRGPGHSAKDRSLAITVGPEYPDGLWCKSFSLKDDDLYCKEWVAQQFGLPLRQPSLPPRRDVPALSKRTDQQDKREFARAIWSEGCDPRNTLAEEYLASRKLDLPPAVCGSALRFHAECLFGNERIPCLIAAFTAIEDGTLAAVHRIRLDQPDRWPKADRMMLGAVTGSAIKFDAAGENLAIGEGIETCLAARQLGFGECWAMGSACQIAKFQPVDGIKSLILLGENCDVNRKAAENCSRLWIRHGREVWRAMPTSGKDLNDYIMMELR